MARKRKNSGNDLLENLRGPQSDNSNCPSEVETTNEGPNLSSNDDNLTPSSSDIGTFPREKDEPLLVTIRGKIEVLLIFSFIIVFIFYLYFIYVNVIIFFHG